MAANMGSTSFLFEGHCGEHGMLAYNLLLDEKRYLEDFGILAFDLLTTSFGKEKPFCKDHNKGCWSKNCWSKNRRRTSPFSTQWHT